MMFPRPGGLRTLIVCLGTFLPLFGQQTPPPPAPAKQPPAPAPAKSNPFETVPQAPPAAAPAPEGAKPAATPAAPAAERPPTDEIEAVDFRGARRVPADTLRAMIGTKKGDPLDPELLN